MTAQDVTDTFTRIISPDFATLKVQRDDDFFAPHIISLDDNLHIIISFDRLGDDPQYLEYSLVHCNALWQPSNLVDSEFSDSFNVAKIEDYAFSTNTFEHYVNYRIEIPNDRMRPTLSGNYLLQVYPESQRDDVLLQARFSVDENKIFISGDVSTSTDYGVNDKWQQLSLKLNPDSHTIRDPFNDLKIIIEQNEQPEQTAVIEHPQRLWGKEIIYEHDRKLIFPALNEFRRFETVRATYPGMNVDSVRYLDNRYHAYLKTDYPKASDNYLYDQTQYGRFLIREYNSTDSDLASDYIQTHFSLDFPQLINADIYIAGEFSHYLPTEQTRMMYNTERGLYELELPLKQGSYNYKYIVIPNDGSNASLELVDGDKYETSNRYDIKVFQYEPSWRADRLVGSATIFSNR